MAESNVFEIPEVQIEFQKYLGLAQYYAKVKSHAGLLHRLDLDREFDVAYTRLLGVVAGAVCRDDKLFEQFTRSGVAYNFIEAVSVAILNHFNEVTDEIYHPKRIKYTPVDLFNTTEMVGHLEKMYAILEGIMTQTGEFNKWQDIFSEQYKAMVKDAVNIVCDDETLFLHYCATKKDETFAEAVERDIKKKLDSIYTDYNLKISTQE